MGIPSYFSYVLKNHKIIKKMIDIKCTSLFLDANSIIYDVIHENDNESDHQPLDNNQIYDKVYNKIRTVFLYKNHIL